MKLYHFTSRDNASEVLANGFKGESCWLSPAPDTVMGEDGRSVLILFEVDEPDEILAPYKREVTEEEIDDDENAVGPGRVFFWYEFPAGFFNSLASRARLIEGDERAELMM